MGYRTHPYRTLHTERFLFAPHSNFAAISHCLAAAVHQVPHLLRKTLLGDFRLGQGVGDARKMFAVFQAQRGCNCIR